MYNGQLKKFTCLPISPFHVLIGTLLYLEHFSFFSFSFTTDITLLLFLKSFHETSKVFYTIFICDDLVSFLCIILTLKLL